MFFFDNKCNVSFLATAKIQFSFVLLFQNLYDYRIDNFLRITFHHDFYTSDVRNQSGKDVQIEEDLPRAWLSWSA